MDVFAMDISALSRALRERKISAVELTRAYIDRIDARDGETGAYLTTTFEQALAQACAPTSAAPTERRCRP